MVFPDFKFIISILWILSSSNVISSIFHINRKLQSRSNTTSFNISTQFGDCLVDYCGDGVCAVNKGKCSFNSTTQTNYCQCSEYYITFPEEDSFKCCYEQKSANTAMLLEIFLGFGFGHFYVGNIFFGFIKALIYIILTVSCFSIIWRVLRSQDQTKSFIFKFTCTICLLLCSCTYIGWQIIDTILFSIGGYQDSNGAPLYGTE